MSLLQNSNAISTGGAYNLESSLRFRSSASAYLSRTPVTSSNKQTFTFSAWIKNPTATERLFTAYVDGNNRTEINLLGSSQLTFYSRKSSSTAANIYTNAVLRDPSAWYHIVVSVDLTNTSVNFYINGELQSTVETETTTNNDTLFNDSNYTMTIGARTTLSNFFDGYMTEVNFVDGQALTPSDFGETDTTTGVWQPKKYTGTYGTNGFYLDMSTSSSTVLDQSSNSNDWTANNMNLTTSSATTYDIMNDVATLTDEDTGNFATWNPLDHYSTNVDFSDANLKHTVPAGSYSNGGVATSTITMSSGKWYCEMTALATRCMMGIAKLPRDNMRYLGDAATGYAYYGVNGNKYNNSSSVSYGATYTTNDVIGVALDLDAGTLTFYKNGVSQGTAYTGLSGEFVFATGNTSIAETISTAVNFGQRPFTYTPPTGYKKLNTYNLPDSTIVDGSQYMNPVLWTGDATASRAITGVGFSPDLVWAKSRTNAYSSRLYDTIRGATKELYSAQTTAETTNTNSLLSFDSDGFTVGNVNSLNQSGSAIVAWNWRGSDSTAVSNTDGTITSTVSANTTSGFSVVTYTGNGTAGSTIGHGLGTAPKMIITKSRTSANDWAVYHSSLTATDAVILNLTNATVDNSAYWNDTEPDANVFTVGTAQRTNYSGQDFVAYCFAEVEGFSKFGSYTGNGSADGPFVFTNFRPAFVMFKTTTIIGHWVIVDAERNTYNVIDNSLYPDTSGSEINTITDVDFLSNGFKWRGVLANETNVNGQVYIYMAFAENPFKNSLAR